MKFRVLLFFLINLSLFAQVKLTNEQYVELYYPIAVRKMVEYKIPASITLAQGILESGSGNSQLAVKANNHFGIKCHTGWVGEGFYMDDDTENECFRVYKTAEESFADHSEFLTTRPRYLFLFQDFATDDYTSWAKGLKDAGYATNPNYPNLLISIIERMDLARFDRMGLEDIKANQAVAVVSVAENGLQEWDDIIPQTAYYVDDSKDVFIYNRVRTVKSKGRQALELATQYGIDLELFMKYNDIHEGYIFSPNQFVYLQPKRKKGTEKTHIVEPGETMWDISQKYGLKMDKLYSKNNMVFDKQAKSGEIVSLKSKRDGAPSIVSYMDVLQERKKLKQIEDNKKQAFIDAQNKALKEENEKKQKALEAQILEQKMREAALLKEMEALKEKQKFDAEQHPPLKESNEIDDKKEVEEEIKPYEAVIVKTHVVQVGETLYYLSNKYYITVEKLKELNKLTDNNLKIGQVLVVSPE